ncbi:MAG: tRNA uridine-5-carboxymethylaminomethyl(34) synthesis GTPase MnmE [Gammaproteobacteria bacterium TMED112]|nr:MAG: tRNA uridine-5-carboxymethylaminomethyl(34) synthesis GTPase MnmE [Gammaproteobacteria bacterium TMED112]|tara:strand:+ start:36166 stop:37458 length:1293 start_codon:yes stop_codon:yes gene_type:complete
MAGKGLDPIFAQGSPPGRSAIAVVRISGRLPDSFYNELNIKKNSRSFFLRKLDFGGFSDSCLVLNFPGPSSYTGESMLEIHSHGNQLIVSELFRWLEKRGLREAEAGEFSKRAFLNSKISLVEAEGVSLGIEAETKDQLVALDSFRSGSLSKKIESVISQLNLVLVDLEAQLDFSDEEGVAEKDVSSIQGSLDSVLGELDALLKNYRPYEKNSLKKRVVLVGRPNVGKSSIFNSLLDEEVAIVSKNAGTTRDVVRKVLPLSGFEVEIEDTAGLRSATNDEVEKTGMGLTIKAASSADLLIYVKDDPKEIVPKEFKERSLVVLNKCDLAPAPTSFSGISVSAKTGKGIDLLLEKMRSLATSSSGQRLVSERTHKKLENTMSIMSKEVGGNDFFEVTAQNIRDANKELNEIYGELDNEKILDQIFKNFCIGK